MSKPLDITPALPTVAPLTARKHHSLAKQMAGYVSEESFQHDKKLCLDFVKANGELNQTSKKRYAIDGRDLKWGAIEAADDAQNEYRKAMRQLEKSANTRQATSDRYHGAKLLADAVDAQ